MAFVFSPQTLDAADPLIGKPPWAGFPDIAEFQRVFPEPAKKAGVLKARIVLGCHVVAGGALAGCTVQSEDPPGLGFGAAALSLSGGFRLGVWSPEGLPTVGGRVSIPLRYELTQVPQS